MSKRTLTPLSYKDLSTSSSSDASDNEISNNGSIKIRKVFKRRKTNKASLQMCPRHPGLTKKHFQLFMKSRTTYIKLIKFIHSKELYFVKNNEICLFTKQNIEEAIKFIFKSPDEQTKNTFSNNISIFLKKYNKEILDDLKNWDGHQKLPVFDPERKLLRIYINDIVDVLLRRQELSHTLIDILIDKKDHVNDKYMDIILRDIHKDGNLNYYRKYLKYILRYHIEFLVEILSKKLVLKIHENDTSLLNKENGFTQPLNQLAISNKNDNAPSINENDDVSKNQSESQLDQLKKLEENISVSTEGGDCLKMSAVIVENYISSLTKLTINSKPYIIRLTTLAEEFIEHAPAIVEAIESHLKKVKPEIKLPALYLIDSIVKNVEQPYLGLFSKNIVNTFCKVFKKVDENTRASMWKLRQTWNNIFPAKKLFALDVRVHNIDPAWHITPLPNNNVSTVDSRESQISIGAENTVDLKLQENVVDSNDQKSIVNKVSSETSENVISSRSLNETQESFEITSSQLIDSIKEEFHFEDQKPPILNGDIITIDDFDNELKPNIKLEENNEDDITSEIFDTLMNNEILLEWDVIKDKHLIKFILNNPDDLQKDRTYKKLLMLQPQIFEGFKPENLRKRKDHLANDYEYLIKLCGFEKIKTEQEKVIFDKRIESLRKLMNFSIKMEVD